ncbi:MAG TPA: NADP-dependent oxidoreductase [Solirubrobacteraceae bacterium]|nr:NADP-dependent oxidoreductase [Solirubrobacteraceae bacterium]
MQFDHFGGPEVLEIRDVPRPVPASGEVLVAVKAAGINPGEIGIREGQLEARWPTTLPCGEGSDFAGIVEELGEGVAAYAAGDEVCGWSDQRASHAEFVVAPTSQLTRKPPGVSFEVAGSLYVASFAAYGSVKAVALQQGEVVAVSAAAGGVGSVAVQLAKRAGATVIGLASERNHDWLRRKGVIPVTYGEGQGERILAAADGRLDAFIDTFGGGYVDLAIELGVAPERINTIADFEAIARVGVHGDGTASVSSEATLRDIVGLVADGELEIPIERTLPLAEVREAYRELALRASRGKIVLLP